MNDEIKIPDQVMEVLVIYSKASRKETDWMEVKKVILRAINPKYRTLFSRRDEKTKIPNFNEFEDQIVEKWRELTGIKLNTDRCVRYDEDITKKE